MKKPHAAETLQDDLQSTIVTSQLGMELSTLCQAGVPPLTYTATPIVFLIEEEIWPLVWILAPVFSIKGMLQTVPLSNVS